MSPFLLEVERRGDPVSDSWQDVYSNPRIKARSPFPFAHNGDNGASTSENAENNGRGLQKTAVERKPIKRKPTKVKGLAILIL